MSKKVEKTDQEWKAELTPEQRAEFLKQHGSKLVPPTPAIPVAPPASP